MAETAMLAIGTIAARTGLAVSAVRYYEEERLVFPVRAASGHRHFRRSDIRRLSFVRIAQQLGFSIADIREQLRGLPEERTPTKRDWEKISTGFRRILDERITAMEVLRDKLDGCIGCGCLSLDKCRLYNPDDAAHAKGSGPRYLMGDRPET
ncbi:redox-sensitive transcriptional activator SoxR [Cochlodiniinecator piscidefendens]|uniref:redox-sensitive transcriptional activator SoxR n=1 Tax=Cochlodiniinecator piscidefendens TaxID=2715756 RepID=UPI00140A5E21|nr:redox-sensitive transcriptional activator SoxR [Cochlodiniinecator piscidefendens]